MTPSIASASAPLRAPFFRDAIDLIRTVGAGLLIAMLLQTVVAQPFTIPSSSMEPGLVTGDYVVTSKFAYGWSRASLPFDPPLGSGRLFGRAAERGDVVVFRLPRDRQQVWVKRVIGLPGDRVRVSSGQVFINERAIRRTDLGVTRDHDAPDRTVNLVRERLPDGRAYTTYDGGSDPGDDTETIVVPAGQYLVMGDNRDNSLDGRWPREVGVGLLPAENIVGRAEWVVASWKSGAGLFKPWTWFKLHSDRFFVRVL
ncbi:MAG TPA: signal peptidase I [Brevundimonas sp.]|uniref:signal peptidase I n=1 Tax=Brevundimonas sp. TaxID=1871086 RepID=UPI002ED8C18A